ncbi:MAG: FAD-dependent monooxygenase [Xanthobacteraceae bacterium]
MAPPRTLLIAGAGIGGLAAALAAARAGFRVVLLERAARLEAVGAGVQLAANATRCLKVLGALDHLARSAVRPDAFHILDGTGGRALAQTPLGAAAERRFGAPFLVAHRSDLQIALLTAAHATGGIALKLGRTVEDFTADEDGVTVLASHNGAVEEYRAAALIGADGIRSLVRDRLALAPAPPVFRERAAWRAMVPMELMPQALAGPTVRLWLGPDAHLVSYPVRAGSAVNLVAVTQDGRAFHGWGSGAAPEEIGARFNRWCPDVRSLIGLPERWIRWALFDIDPLKRWGRGRVTLLGDAAHAMLPFLAQGAAQALEDATVLGTVLAAAGEDLEPALRLYEARRMARTAKVQRAARGADTVYHLSGAGRLARNTVLRARSGEAAMERYGWIYRWAP